MHYIIMCVGTISYSGAPPIQLFEHEAHLQLSQ